jgi:hypothetical protein
LSSIATVACFMTSGMDDDGIGLRRMSACTTPRRVLSAA